MSNSGFSPDLYNACNKNNLGVPKNCNGYQFAHTGVGYAGFYCEAGAEQRKYLEVKLDSTLKSGKKYCVEYYVSLADTVQEAFGAFGVYFSKDSVLSTDYHALPVIPQVVMPDTDYITDKINWTLITGTCFANGGKQFITIGNFNNDANTKLVKVPGGNEDYVTECSSGQGINEFTNNLQFNLYPNPATTEVTIETSIDKPYSIRIFSLLGELIYSKEQLASEKADIELTGLSKGVYVVELIETSSGLIGRKKIIVQ